jgi:hypothetical protein
MRRALVAILVVMFIAQGASAYSFTYAVVDGRAWLDCTGEANISNNGIELANGTSFEVDISAGNATVFAEHGVDCQFVLPTMDDMPNLRPAPGVEFATTTVQLCSQEYFFIGYCDVAIMTGDMTNDSADVFAIPVETGEMFRINLMGSSSDLDVQLHFQTNESETVIGEITTPSNTSINGMQPLFIPISDEGRIVATVTSQSPDTLWSMTVHRIDVSSPRTVDYPTFLNGIGRVPIRTPFNPTQSLEIVALSEIAEVNNSLDASIRMLQGGSWGESSNYSVGDKIFSMAGVELIEITVDCDCYWTSRFQRESHADANSDHESPSLIPMGITSDNSSWPLIEMDGSIIQGELTLENGDWIDVLRIETTGWNESIHLIDLILEGDVRDMKVKILDINQRTWDIHDSNEATFSMNNIETSLTVGRGTHFIIIEHVNGSAAANDDAEILHWNLRVNTIVLDEGEEPWFPPSEEVQNAAVMLRWALGFGFLIPAVLLLIHLRGERLLAAEMATAKNRLEWLRQRLEKGEPVEKDLARALRAVASLEWEEALVAWGDPTIRHHTSGIDIAVWVMDDIMATKGAWPLLIGLNPQDEEWEVAAVRFEAPEGEHWEISKVEPRLLYRSHEVFVDTLAKGTRFFLKVELTGGGNALDIHLSGIVDGSPMAAKPTQTITRSSEEE